MPDDHRPAMPQVTTVDDQFGTHRLCAPRQTAYPSRHGDGLAAGGRFTTTLDGYSEAAFSPTSEERL